MVKVRCDIQSHLDCDPEVGSTKLSLAAVVRAGDQSDFKRLYAC